MTILNIEKIKNLIPHRKPFLFIEECKIIEKGKIGESFRMFDKNEYFFEGHFPNNPIVPGVIIVEALAQAAGVVGGQIFTKEDRSVLFMSLNSVKFRKSVKPNEEITLEVSKLNQVKNVYKFSGIAKIGTQIITESTFTAMII